MSYADRKLINVLHNISVYFPQTSFESLMNQPKRGIYRLYSYCIKIDNVFIRFLNGYLLLNVYII